MRKFRSQTVAAIGLTLLALFSTACESDEDPQATSTVSPTPASRASSTSTVTSTPDYGAPDPCPVAVEICDFATELQRLISTADVDDLDALLQPSDFVCPGLELGAGGPFPLCDGASAGDVRKGFPIQRLQSDGSTVEVSLLPQLRMAILDDGDSYLGYYVQPHVVGIHCPVRGGSPDCGGEIRVHLSLQNPGTHLIVSPRDGALRLIGLQMGDTGEGGPVYVHGGPLLFPSAPMAEGWFFPWNGHHEPDPGHEVPRRWLFASPQVSGVTVSPARGECPATLTLRLLETPDTKSGDAPHAEVWIAAGVRGLQHTIGIPGRPPLVKVTPPWLADGRSVEVALEPDMLNGTFCDAETISLIAWGGAEGPVVGGYAIEP